MSRITLIGCLGADCTEKKFDETRKVLNFNLAENIKRQNKETGEVTEFAQWFSCSYFTNGNKIADYLKKGRRVMVSGKFEIQEYKSTKTGELRYVNNIVCDDLQIIDFEDKVKA